MLKNQIRKIALVTAVACASSLTALALPTSYYSSTSTLASGKWVKIKVSESGIHQITYAQLREWGFSDPSKVAVYGYPASLLSDNKGSQPTTPTTCAKSTPITINVATKENLLLWRGCHRCINLHRQHPRHQKKHLFKLRLLLPDRLSPAPHPHPSSQHQCHHRLNPQAPTWHLTISRKRLSTPQQPAQSTLAHHSSMNPSRCHFRWSTTPPIPTTAPI